MANRRAGKGRSVEYSGGSGGAQGYEATGVPVDAQGGMNVLASFGLSLLSGKPRVRSPMLAWIAGSMGLLFGPAKAKAGLGIIDN